MGRNGGFAGEGFRCYKRYMTTIHYDPDPSHWDAYVAGCQSAMFSHFWGWAEAMASAYDTRIFRLAAEDRGGLAGLLPLALFSAPGTDKRLISLPYTDAAGILADNDDTAALLVQSALDLAADLGVQHLELRQASGAALMLPPENKDWSNPCAYRFKTGLARLLPPSSKTLWSSLGPKVRNQIRKAKKCGCITQTGGIELVEDFYAVFSENMRDLGSPVHSLSMLEKTVKDLAARIFMVYLEGFPAAGAVVFTKGSTLFNPWASSLKRFRPRCPNMLLYWTMLSYGVENGFDRFDFGRSSPDAATCRFKLQWGAVMEPLTWHVVSRPGFQWDPRRESLVDEDWKKMDLQLSLKQGPGVRRWISL